MITTVDAPTDSHSATLPRSRPPRTERASHTDTRTRTFISSYSISRQTLHSRTSQPVNSASQTRSHQRPTASPQPWHGRDPWTVCDNPPKRAGVSLRH